MQYTENYQFRKPVIGVDDADVKDINFNSDRADTLIHNTQISLAPAYDLNETYDTGDVVMYETLMYKCKADNTTGAWDASKWERTTAGEEGAGGGGSSVVPNPQGTPTETLNTIGIDGTIFDIAGSGGGGTGEGSFYKETTLWSGSDSATMTLSESFENYDAIMLIGKNTYDNVNYSISGIWLTSYLKTHINDGMQFGLANDSWYVYFSITNGTTLVRQGQYSVYISEIKGLKFGGGASTSITTLYDTFINSVGEITLTNKIEDYDFIMVDFGFNGTDKAHNYIYIPADDFPNKYPYVSSPNNTNPHILLNPYDDQYARMLMGSANNKLYIFQIGQTVGIYGIYGIKCGGGSGSGGGYSETSLYTYTGSTRQTTLSLSDAYTDYDAVEFTFGWNLGGDEFETVNVISSSKIVSNVFVNVGGEGRYNYVSRGGADDEIILATATGSWDGSSIIREVRGINY